MGELIEINVDLVKELRGRGEWAEAQNLIDAYQQNKKANIKQMRKEMATQQHKKYVLKNKDKIKEYQDEWRRSHTG